MPRVSPRAARPPRPNGRRSSDEQRAYFEKQLGVERVTWASREAEALAAKIAVGLQEMETYIADTTAMLLKPFLTEAIRQRAVSDLVQTIGEVVFKNEGVALEIAGPEDLLQLLREKLSSRNMALLFTPSEGPEVRVVAGQTILETQLAAWLSRVEEALR